MARRLQGAKGNEGVTGQVKQVLGSIGYVELVYAVQQEAALCQREKHGGELHCALHRLCYCRAGHRVKDS